MFTIAQIKNAHSKVKSGADFPEYIQDILKLGVIYFETYVFDGHTNFFGTNGFKISSEGEYLRLQVADKSNLPQFKTDLKTHQKGNTDYPTFCKNCATSGVEKWIVSIVNMTCSYYDKEGKVMLVETIPTP